MKINFGDDVVGLDGLCLLLDFLDQKDKRKKCFPSKVACFMKTTLLLRINYSLKRDAIKL